MKKKIIIVAAICACVILAIFAIKITTGRFAVAKKEAALPLTIPEAQKKIPPIFNEVQGLLDKGDKANAIKRLEDIAVSNKGSNLGYESFMMLADICKQDNNLTKAKECYLAVTNEYSQYCDYAAIRKDLNDINIAILFSNIPTPDSEVYTVVPGDSLTKIARSYNTTVELIKRANALTKDIIMPGQKLKVQKLPFSIVVDKSQNLLTLTLKEEVVKTYNVSTGKNNSTPVGTFKIKDKLVDPVWYSTNAVVPSGSPGNILGTRWMGLTTPKPGFGIHGTTEPESIGQQSTEGCIRMLNEDVEELYAIIPVGTEVNIID